MAPALRAALLGLAASLPVVAAQKTATFRVGAVVRPSARLIAEPGGVVEGRARLRLVGNAPAPAAQVGNGPLRIVEGGEIALPQSGTVVVTLQY